MLKLLIWFAFILIFYVENVVNENVPGTNSSLKIHIRDIFWTANYETAILRQCARKFRLTYDYGVDFDKLFCMPEDHKEVCFVKCVFETKRLITKDGPRTDHMLYNVQLKNNLQKNDIQMEIMTQILRKCERRWKIINDIDECERYRGYAYCIFREHTIYYEHINTTFCEPLVNLEFALDAMLARADPKQCPQLTIQKSSDIFAACLDSCILRQTGLIHNDGVLHEVTEKFFDWNPRFAVNRAVRHQIELFLNRCWQQVLQKRLPPCKHEISFKMCMRRFHELYRIRGPDCDTKTVQINGSVVSLLPHPERKLKVFDTCYELHRRQLYTLEELFLDRDDNCDVYFCVLNELGFVNGSKGILFEQILNNVVARGLVKTNQEAYNRVKDLLWVCRVQQSDKTVTVCMQTLRFLDCLRNDVRSKWIFAEQLIRPTVPLDPENDPFFLLENYEDVLMNCKADGQPIMARIVDVYNLVEKHHVELRNCIFNGLKLVKNNKLDSETFLRQLRNAPQIYNPKEPEALAYLEIRAYLRNCAAEKDLAYAVICLRDTRAYYGFPQYFRWDPLSIMNTSIRIFVNDSLNYTECYKASPRLKMPVASDIMAMGTYNSPLIENLMDCVIKKQAYYPYEEKRVSYEQLLKGKVPDYEARIIQTITRECESDMTRDCLRLMAVSFNFVQELRFDPYLKMNVSLADLLSQRLDDSEVLEICKGQNLATSKDVFNIKDDPKLIQCIFEKNDIFDKFGLNIDGILQNLLDKTKLDKKNSREYRQIRASLNYCKHHSAVAVRDCLVRNNNRFGYLKMEFFKPALKLRLSLYDLLKSGQAMDAVVTVGRLCRNFSRDPIVNVYDVLNLKNASDDRYVACIFKELKIVRDRKLDVDAVLKRLPVAKGSDRETNIRSLLEKCRLQTNAWKLKTCLTDNGLRFGFDPLLEFDPQLKLNKTLANLLAGDHSRTLQLCNNQLAPVLSEIEDVFNLNATKHQYLTECVLENSKFLLNNVINPDAILKSCFERNEPRPVSAERLVQVATFLKVCYSSVQQLDGLMKCLRDNAERFGFEKPLVFEADLNYMKPLTYYLGLEQTNGSVEAANAECFKRFGLRLQNVADIFAIKTIENETHEEFIHCLLNNYGLMKGDRLSTNEIIDKIKVHMMGSYVRNFETILRLCDSPHPITCLKKYSRRFGFKATVDFDPFLKSNFSLRDLLRADRNEAEVLNRCNAAELLVKCEDVFMLKAVAKTATATSDVVRCVFKEHGMMDEYALNVDSILQNVIDNGRASAGDSVYLQAKALIETCRILDAIEFRDCLVRNAVRFGLEQSTSFDPALKLNLTLLDFLNRTAERESCEQCHSLSARPLLNCTDVFNIKTESEQDYVDCLLRKFAIIDNESRLDSNPILRKLNLTANNTAYRNINGLLVECKSMPNAFEISRCLRENAVRFGLAGLLDFDAQLKLPFSLENLLPIDRGDTLIEKCDENKRDNGQQPTVYDIRDIFNLNATKHASFLECVLSESHVLHSETLDVYAILESLFGNDPIRSATYRQMKTYLSICASGPNTKLVARQLSSIVDCLKRNDERFGLKPLRKFDSESKFELGLGDYLGLETTVDNSGDGECYKQHGLKLVRVSDIFSLKDHKSTKINGLIQCVLANRNLSNGTIFTPARVDSLLEPYQSNLTANQIVKFRMLFEICNQSIDMFECFTKQSKRFGFKTLNDFDPLLKIDLSLDDFFDAATATDVNETAAIEKCSSSASSTASVTRLKTARDVLNLNGTNTSEIVNCIFDVYKIYTRATGLNRTQIFRTLSTRHHIDSHSSEFKQISALLNECAALPNAGTAVAFRDCLIANNDRFGFRFRLRFDPNLQFELKLADLLLETAADNRNAASCQTIVPDPIYDPRDVFSIRSRRDTDYDSYIYCILTQFGIVKNSQLQKDTILANVRRKNGASERQSALDTNIQSFLAECEQFTGPLDIKNCFTRNYLRFGFEALPDFDPQLKLSLDLDRLMCGANESTILNSCPNDWIRLRHTIDVFNLNTTKYSNLSELVECIFRSAKILDDNRLNIDAIIASIYPEGGRADVEKNTVQIRTFLETCNQTIANQDHIAVALLNCLIANHQRFGFNALLRFDPLLKFNSSLATILGVHNSIPEIEQCNRVDNDTELELHDVADIFQIDRHEHRPIKALITCVLVKSNVLRDNPLEIERILERNRDTLTNEHYEQLRSFLELCSRVKDVVGCMKNNSKRFGFESQAEFDPLLKMNVSLASLMGLHTADYTVLKTCGTTVLKKSEDIFNVKDSSENNELFKCVMENHGILEAGSGGVRVSSVLANLTKSGRVRINDPSYRQIREFLTFCNHSQPIDVKRCFIANRARFGFREIANFDPQLSLNRTLASLVQNDELVDSEVWTKCRAAHDPQAVLMFSDLFSITDPKTINTYRNQIECILKMHRITDDSGLVNMHEMKRRFANKLNDSIALDQAVSLLELCANELAAKLFECMSTNSDRVGFAKPFDFDPFTKLPFRLDSILLGPDGIWDAATGNNLLDACYNATGLKLANPVDFFNLRNTGQLDKCIWEAFNVTGAADGLLNRATIRERFGAYDNRTLKHLSTLFAICEQETMPLKECLLANSDRFGFERVREFDPLLKTNLSMTIILTESKSLHSCESRNRMRLNSIEDIFSLNVTKELVYLKCLLEKSEVLMRNGSLNRDGVLGRLLKFHGYTPTDPVYRQIEALLDECNLRNGKPPALIINCLIRNNDRYGFRPIRNFDPCESIGLELADLLPQDAEKSNATLTKCRAANNTFGLMAIGDIWNLPDTPEANEVFACVADEYQLMESSSSSAVLLDALKNRFRIDETDSKFRNSKALLETCTAVVANLTNVTGRTRFKHCLVTNTERFGFKQLSQFDPTLKCNFSVVDFLEPLAHVDACQKKYNRLLVDPRDLFLLVNETTKEYVSCLMYTYGLISSNKLSKEAALNALVRNTKMSRSDREFGQAVALLELCEERTDGVLESMKCLRTNSKRFGLKDIRMFETGALIELTLDQLLGLDAGAIGAVDAAAIDKKCVADSGLSLVQLADILNLNTQTNRKLIECVLNEIGIVTADERRLNKSKLIAALETKFNWSRTDVAYKNLETLIEMCDEQPELIQTFECFRTNANRFGLKNRITFDPLLKLPLKLDDILPRMSRAANILTGCSSESGFGLLAIEDILHVNQTECDRVPKCQSFFECVLRDLSMFTKHGSIDVTAILSHIDTNRNMKPNSNEYRQIKAFLETCSQQRKQVLDLERQPQHQTRKDLLKCLLANRNRFGFEPEPFFDPLLKFDFNLSIFFDWNTTDKRVCRLIIDRDRELILSEMHDVFLIDTNRVPEAEYLIKCVFEKFRVWKSGRFDTDAMMGTIGRQAINVTRGSNAWHQLETFLGKCRHETDPSAAKTCLTKNSERFGFRKLMQFDPLMRLGFTLGVFVKPALGSSCYAKPRDNDEDIFRLSRDLSAAEVAVIECVLKKQEIVVRDSILNRDEMMARAAKQIRTSDFLSGPQVESFLKTCALTGRKPNDLRKCLIRNAARFGFRKLSEFDLFRKTNLSLADLIPADKDTNLFLLSKCESETEFRLRKASDIFAVNIDKCPKTRWIFMNPCKTLVECIFSSYELMNANGLDIKSILRNFPVEKSQLFEPFLQQCVGETDATDIFRCLLWNRERFGIEAVPEFDPLIEMDLSLTDLIPLTDLVKLERQCRNATDVKDQVAIRNIGDIFNIDLNESPALTPFVVCFLTKALFLIDGKINKAEILRKKFQNSKQVEQFLTICGQLPLVQMMQCIRENNDRFGFRKMPDFRPDLKLNVTLAVLMRHDVRVELEQCYRSANQSLWQSSDIFSARSSPVTQPLIDCVLEANFIVIKDRLDVAAAMRNIGKNLPAKFPTNSLKQIEQFLLECATRAKNEIFSCLIENHLRFGFRESLEFDPFLKLPFGLQDLIADDRNEVEVLKECLAGTKVLSSAVLFNAAESQNLTSLVCLMKRKGLVDDSTGKLNRTGIMRLITARFNLSDLQLKQFRGFLDECDHDGRTVSSLAEAQTLQKCLIENGKRFGLGTVTSRDTLPAVNLSVSDLMQMGADRGILTDLCTEKMAVAAATDFDVLNPDTWPNTKSFNRLLFCVLDERGFLTNNKLEMKAISRGTKLNRIGEHVVAVIERECRAETKLVEGDKFRNVENALKCLFRKLEKSGFAKADQRIANENDFVYYHNRLRVKAMRKFNISNMLRLRTIDWIAKEAKELAGKCDYREIEKRTHIGVMLTEERTWKQVFETYFDPMLDRFRYGGEPVDGPMLNLTNILWATSRLVGCSMAPCREYFRLANVLYVCVYSPKIEHAQHPKLSARPFLKGNRSAECPNDNDRTLNLCTNYCTLTNAELTCNKEICEQSTQNVRCNATCFCPAGTISYNNPFFRDDVIETFVADLNELRASARKRFFISYMPNYVISEKLTKIAENLLQTCPKLDADKNWFIDANTFTGLQTFLLTNRTRILEQFEASLKQRKYNSYFVTQTLSLLGHHVGCHFKKCDRNYRIYCVFEPELMPHQISLDPELLEVPCRAYVSPIGNNCLDYCLENADLYPECATAVKKPEPEYVRVANDIRRTIAMRDGIINMLKLVSSSRLVSEAVDMLKSCSTNPPGKNQSLFATSDTNRTWSQLLFDDFVRDSNRFRYGQTIGSNYNYANLLWATSFRMGCASQKCGQRFHYGCVFYPPVAHRGHAELAVLPYEIGNRQDLCMGEQFVDQKGNLCLNYCVYYNAGTGCETKLNGTVSGPCDQCMGSCLCPKYTIFYEDRTIPGDFTADILVKLNMYRSKQTNKESIAHLVPDRHLEQSIRVNPKFCNELLPTDVAFDIETTNLTDIAVQTVDTEFRSYYEIGCAVKKCMKRFKLRCRFAVKMPKPKCQMWLNRETLLCADHCGERGSESGEACKQRIRLVEDTEYVIIANKYRREIQKRFNVTNMLKLHSSSELESEAKKQALKCVGKPNGTPATLLQMGPQASFLKANDWEFFFKSFMYDLTDFPDNVLDVGQIFVAKIWYAASSSIGCYANACINPVNKQTFYLHVCVLRPDWIRGSMPFEIEQSAERINAKCVGKFDPKTNLCLNSCPYADQSLYCKRLDNIDPKLCQATRKCATGTIAAQSFDIKRDISLVMASLFNIERSNLLERLELKTLNYVVYSRSLSDRLETATDTCKRIDRNRQMIVPLHKSFVRLPNQADLLDAYNRSDYVDNQLKYLQTNKIGCTLTNCTGEPLIQCVFEPNAPADFQLNFWESCGSFEHSKTKLCMKLCGSDTHDFDNYTASLCWPYRKHGHIATVETTTVKERYKKLPEHQRLAIMADDMFTGMLREFGQIDVSIPFNDLRSKIYHKLPYLSVNHLSFSITQAFALFVHFGRSCNPKQVNEKNGFFVFHENEYLNLTALLKKHFPVDKVVKELHTTTDYRMIQLMDRNAKHVGCILSKKCYPYRYTYLCHFRPELATGADGPPSVCRRHQHKQTKLCLDYCETDRIYEPSLCREPTSDEHFCMTDSRNFSCSMSCSCLTFKEPFQVKNIEAPVPLENFNSENFQFPTTENYQFTTKDIENFFEHKRNNV